MNAVLEQLSKIGIVPVVVINDAKDAAPLAEALVKGGLPCAEVTFRTDAAEAVDDYVVYFDNFKYTTNTLSNVYDGYALRNADFGDSKEGSSDSTADAK